MLELYMLFSLMSKEFNLPENLLHSICYIESKHDVDAIHIDDGTTNSVGVCQVKQATAQWLGFKGNEADLMNPKNNIRYAAKYLAYQMKRYNNIPRAVVAYNRGNAIGLTRSSYSDKVIEHWASMQKRSASNE